MSGGPNGSTEVRTDERPVTWDLDMTHGSLSAQRHDVEGAVPRNGAGRQCVPLPAVLIFDSRWLGRMS